MVPNSIRCLVGRERCTNSVRCILLMIPESKYDYLRLADSSVLCLFYFGLSLFEVGEGCLLTIRCQMSTAVDVQCDDEKNQISTKGNVYQALNLAPKG